MIIELIFEDEIFKYDPKYLPHGYTKDELKNDRPDCLDVNMLYIPNVGDDIYWDKEECSKENPYKSTKKQWGIIKGYSFRVVSRAFTPNGYVGLNLEVI